jgi:hypothetical protein
MPDFNINLELIAGSKGQLVVNVRSGNGTMIRQETACTVRGWQSCFEAIYKALYKIGFDNGANDSLDSVKITFAASGSMADKATGMFESYLSNIRTVKDN